MSDDVDVTTAREEIQANLAREYRKNRVQISSPRCKDCDEKISTDRQKATGGSYLCVGCATDREARKRFFK